MVTGTILHVMLLGLISVDAIADRRFAAPVVDHDAFPVFIHEHGRNYTLDSREYIHRRALFERSLKEVQQLNSNPDRLWEAAMNHFGDWTDREFKSLFGYFGHAVRSATAAPARAWLATDGLGGVSDGLARQQVWQASTLDIIEDQKLCGSCWAFAAAKMAEANLEIMTGEHRSFSTQHLVDCVPNPQECGGTGGCSGATVELALHFMAKQGCATKEDLPYLGVDGNCTNPVEPGSFLGHSDEEEVASMESLALPGIKTSTSTGAQAIRLFNWERLPENQEAPLRAALMEGTVAVAAAATMWQFYFGGIFNTCSKNAVVNHALLAIGYSHDDQGRKFWILQNSWGRLWGEKGRIRLLRPDDTYCGVDSRPEDGTACKGGPSSVPVCGMCGVLFDSVIARFQ